MMLRRLLYVPLLAVAVLAQSQTLAYLNPDTLAPSARA